MSDRNKRILKEVFHRTFQLDIRAGDDEERTVEASLSSEQPVSRWYGEEVLTHSPSAVDLSRSKGGLPMLFGHNTEKPIGRVDDIRIEEGKLRGTMRFSKNSTANEVWQDVKDGFLRNVSIGYQVKKWEEEENSDRVTITKWSLLEASIVTVPADASVGVNRSLDMDTTAEQDDVTTNVTAITKAHQKGVQEGKRNAVQETLARVEEINEIFERYLDPTDAIGKAIRDAAVKGLWDQARCMQAILDHRQGERSPLADVEAERREQPLARRVSQQYPSHDTFDRSPIIQAGPDASDKNFQIMQRALEVRAGLEKDKEKVREARESGYVGMTLSELAREFARVNRIQLPSNEKERVIGHLFTVRTAYHGSGDFTNLLESISSKAMMTGWTEAPETWQVWTMQTSVPDFKAASRVNMSTFGDLDVIPEHGEYKYGTFSDLKESIQARTYGKLFAITRQAIINDDLSAFSTIPMKMGRAANRMVGDEVYGILTTNPALSDTIAIFHSSSHGANLVTSGGAPSVTTLTVGYRTMAVQTDPAGNVLNIGPRYLITSKKLEIPSQTLLMATYDPAGSAGTLPPNPFQGRLTGVYDPRLDAYESGNAWFLAADPATNATIEVAFLDGRQEPFLDQQAGWTVDGVSYKVRLDFGTKCLDYRGLFQNDGA